MLNGKDIFDTWLKSQEQAWGALNDMTEQFRRNLAGTGGSGMPGFGGGGNGYGNWAQYVMGAMNGGGGEAELLRETLKKSFEGSNAYMKLYEIWFPLAKAFQSKSADPAMLKDMMEPAKYKELMDSVFKIDQKATDELMAQGKKLMEACGTTAGGFMKPWSEAAEAGMKSFPNFLEGRPETFLGMYHKMFDAFDRTAGRTFHVPTVGKDREKLELILRGMDEVSVYLAKRTVYEHMIYVTGGAAFEKVVAAMAEKTEKSAGSYGFDEFFNIWIEVNEKEYYSLFQSEEFSRVQGELLDASLDVRRHFFKLMELYLYDLPIALRSEMDDLYKTVYEMKKTIKVLEKRLSEAKG